MFANLLLIKSSDSEIRNRFSEIISSGINDFLFYTFKKSATIQGTPSDDFDLPVKFFFHIYIQTGYPIKSWGHRNYKFTIIGVIVISHHCRAGARFNRCSRSNFSWPETLTPFLYGASNSRVTVRSPFQKKLPARFNTVSTVSNKYPFHDFSNPAQ
jgi:hypothetical protein